MKRSVTFRLLVAIVLGIASLFSLIGTATAAVIEHGTTWLKEKFSDRVDPARADQTDEKPRVDRLRAVSYRLRRLIRRESVVLMPGYRSCPTV